MNNEPGDHPLLQMPFLGTDDLELADLAGRVASEATRFYLVVQVGNLTG